MTSVEGVDKPRERWTNWILRQRNIFRLHHIAVMNDLELGGKTGHVSFVKYPVCLFCHPISDLLLCLILQRVKLHRLGIWDLRPMINFLLDTASIEVIQWWLIWYWGSKIALFKMSYFDRYGKWYLSIAV